MKSRWKEFVVDIGDTVGGILIGASIDKANYPMLISGVLLLMTSIYLEYFKKGKEDGTKTS